MISYFKNLFKFITLVLVGCSSQVEPPKYFQKQANYRTIASNQDILNADDQKIHLCMDTVTDTCFKKNSFYENLSENQIDAKSLERKKKFHLCVLNNSLKCGYEYSNQSVIEAINNLKKEFVINDNVTTLNWTRLRNYNFNYLTQIHRDVLEIENLFNANSAKSYNGLSIDNRDFQMIPVNFHGIVINNESELTMYCRNELPQDDILGSMQRRFYKNSLCRGKIDIKGQKLLLIFKNGNEIIFNFNFGLFAKRFNESVDYERIKVEKLAEELEILFQSKQVKLTYELLIAKHMLLENSKVLNPDFRQLAKYNDKSDYKGHPNLKAFLRTIGSALDQCVYYSVTEGEGLDSEVSPGSYIVSYGQFGKVNQNLNTFIQNIDGLKILHPFLLNNEQVDTLMSFAQQSQAYSENIQKNCKKKRFIQFDYKFLVDEVM